MTVKQLIYNYQKYNPDGHCFDHYTLKFFGERRSEMRVLANTAQVKDWSGNLHECYVLSALQRNHPLGPKRAYHYFDKNTFELISR